jgi:hypothetical protein
MREVRSFVDLKCIGSWAHYPSSVFPITRLGDRESTFPQGKVFGTAVPEDIIASPGGSWQRARNELLTDEGSEVFRRFGMYRIVGALSLIRLPDHQAWRSGIHLPQGKVLGAIIVVFLLQICLRNRDGCAIIVLYYGEV